MTLALKTGILYGPVNSRRYGRSLGINLSPCDYKLCSFNCIYCHFGWTDVTALTAVDHAKDLPAPEEVIRAVDEALQSDLEFDQITFSGNGEPTLYPEFAVIVDAVRDLIDQFRPDVKLALLSNSTGLLRDDVRRVVPKIDLPVFKLDAGNDRLFRQINRPAKGIQYSDILLLLRALDNIYIQTVLVDGDPSNITKRAIDAWYERIAEIKPKAVHLYSIDRPVPHTKITLVSPERLRQIAREGEARTGIPIHAYTAQGATSR